MGGIVIRRSHHAQQFVTIPNATARDKRLSFRARGLLVTLLSYPPGWKVTTASLAREYPDGRDALRVAMAELRAVGYVVLHTDRDKRGHLTRWLEVFDVPSAEA